MAVAFLVGGIAMGAGAIALFNYMRTFAATATTCIGTLVAYQSVRSKTDSLANSGAANHYPIVEFLDATGTKRRFTASTGSNQKPYDIGAEITVQYDPKDPESADIESKLYQWMIPALVVGLGAAAFAVGVAIW
ncbi:MAG: DUF3592 domain-containing protein [Rhodoferax sp.]